MWTFHLNVIIQQKIFCDWLLSLSIRVSGIIYTVACVSTSFLSIDDYTIHIIWIYYMFFIYSLVDRHLSCFHLLKMKQEFVASCCPLPSCFIAAVRDQIRERGATTNQQDVCVLFPEEVYGRKESENVL